MFWRMPALSASSPVELILDKENFSLEELLDEEEIIQECKALNSRLINFLRDGAQVEQLLRYVVQEPPEDAESKRIFKFPFIACEIFTCEVDVIFKTLVEREELMNLLFSFLEPNRPHGTLLAGYFSKVVVCLMLRKTVPLMNYVQAHQDIFRKLVDLIGITSIMEVLVRLVGTDDHMYPNFVDVMQWLADSNLLEMIVDKLSPSSSPEVHANAAETLCAITRNVPSPLTAKISSSCFIQRIFGHALENSTSKSTLVYSLSVCISLLDPKRSTSSPFIHSLRSQHLYELPLAVHPETVTAMLPKFGDLLMLLDVSADKNALPTTYGELRPPLGKHRLKIVEFITVLLKTGNEVAENELVRSGAIKKILALFFEFPFNNALHHHVESIIVSCLESNNSTIVDHLFLDCDLIGKLLNADRHSILSGDSSLPTVPASGRNLPRTGNIGHITRIANKIIQLGNGSRHIHPYLQENSDWLDWQANILHERNTVENVYRWACGRPTALHERTRDSDEEELHDRDYDVAALADDISNAFRYNMYENEDREEARGSLGQDDEDGYFDDESAEVVISSLRLGDDQESSLFTNSNWFAFQEDRMENEYLRSSSPPEGIDELNLGVSANGGSSSSDDEVVVGEDEDGLVTSSTSINDKSGFGTKLTNGISENNPTNEKILNPDHDLFGDRSLPDWVGWRYSTPDYQIGGHDGNPFKDDMELHMNISPAEAPVSFMGEAKIPNGSTGILDSADGLKKNETTSRSMPSLFEEDVEFVEGTEKAMEHALKEGIVGEAGPLKRNLITSRSPEKGKSGEDDAGILEFNDTNYWRVEQVGVVQE